MKKLWFYVCLFVSLNAAAQSALRPSISLASGYSYSGINTFFTTGLASEKVELAAGPLLNTGRSGIPLTPGITGSSAIKLIATGRSSFSIKTQYLYLPFKRTTSPEVKRKLHEAFIGYGYDIKISTRISLITGIAAGIYVEQYRSALKSGSYRGFNTLLTGGLRWR